MLTVSILSKQVCDAAKIATRENGQMFYETPTDTV